MTFLVRTITTRSSLDGPLTVTYSNTDSNTQTNSGPVTTATIPYIRGTSETIASIYILQPYNKRV